jgi:hypothetical protein
VVSFSSNSRLCLWASKPLDATFSTEASHKHFYRKLSDMWHAWYLDSQWRPLDSGGFKGRLLFPGHQAMWESITCCNSKYMAIGNLITTNNFCVLYGQPGSILLTLDALLSIPFQNNKWTACQPRSKHVVLLTMHNFVSYSTPRQTLLQICQSISTHLRPSQLYFLIVIGFKLRPLSATIALGKS